MVGRIYGLLLAEKGLPGLQWMCCHLQSGLDVFRQDVL